MPPKPASKAARKPAAVFAKSGETIDSLKKTAEEAVRLKRTRAITTKKLHSVELQRLVEFARTFEGDLSIFPGNPATPEDVIRENAGELTHTVLHPFALWRITSSLGRLNERITLSYAKHSFDTFASAYRIETNGTISQSSMISVKAYIDSIAEEHGVIKAHKEKPTPDGLSLTAFLKQIFSPDFAVATTRRRIEVMAFCAGAVTSASRCSGMTVHPAYAKLPNSAGRGLRWKDIEFFVHAPEISGQDNSISCRLTLRHTKTGSGEGRKYVMTLHSLHAHSGPLFFLALAILDGVLVDDPTAEQIFSETSLAGDRIKQLGIKDVNKDLYVFRRCDDGELGRTVHPTAPMSSGAMGKHFELLSRLAGFAVNLHPHTLRRMAAVALLQSGSSIETVQYHLGHKLGSDIIKFYMSTSARADVTAALLGESSAAGIIQSLDAHPYTHDPARPIALSPEWREKVMTEPEVREAFEAAEAVEAELVAAYGRPDQAPAADLARYKDLYGQARNAYNRHHRWYYGQQLEEYTRKKQQIAPLVISAEAAIAAASSSSTSAATAPSPSTSTSAPVDETFYNLTVDRMPNGNDIQFNLSSFLEAVDGEDFTNIEVQKEWLQDPGAMDQELARMCKEFLNEWSDDMLDPALEAVAAAEASTSTTNASTGLLTVNPADLQLNTGDAGSFELPALPALDLLQPLPPLSEVPELPPLSPLPPVDTSSLPPMPMPLPGSEEYATAPLDNNGLPSPSTSNAPTRASTPVLLQGPRTRRAGGGKRGASISAMSERSGSHRSASVSAVSEVASAQDAESSDSEDEVELPQIHPMETLQAALFTPGVSAKYALEKMLELPEAPQLLNGFYPGFAPYGNPQCCPGCHGQLDELIERKPKENTRTYAGKRARHVMKCCALAAREEDLPQIRAYFEQDQPCPFCTEGDNDDESEKEDETVARTKGKSKGKSKAKEQEESLRGPGQWSDHIRRHTRKVEDDGGQFINCKCGTSVRIEYKVVEAHLMVSHRLYISRTGPAAALKLFEIAASTIPEPPFSLQDGKYHANPAEWETFCQSRYDTVFKLKEDLPCSYARRTDVTYPTVTPNFQHIDQPGAEEDLKYCGELGLTDAGAPLREAMCVLCPHLEREAFSFRMAPINPKKLRPHYEAHFWSMWQLRAERAHREKQRETAAAAGETSDEEVFPATLTLKEILEAELTLEDFGSYRCQDPVCNNLVLGNILEYLNHLCFIHRVPTKLYKTESVSMTFASLSLQTMKEVKTLLTDNSKIRASIKASETRRGDSCRKGQEQA